MTADLTSVYPVFERADAYPFQHPVRVFHNPHRPEEIWVTSFGNGLRVGNSSPLVPTAQAKRTNYDILSDPGALSLASI